MKIIIGIDDTDNKRSRGTGFRARQLGQLLAGSGMAEVETISRHQLLVDKRIPYTSHNSSASVVCHLIPYLEDIIRFCTKFLKRKSAWFSDAGLCVCPYDEIPEEILNWGNRAKKEILTKEEALNLTDKNNIFLQGLTGKKIGVIGALAAVGLRKAGNDGRLLWMKNMRELNGVFTTEELFKSLKIDKIADITGMEIPGNSGIYMTDWSRPVHKNNEITLFVEEVKDNEQYKWRVASKEFIKSISK